MKTAVLVFPGSNCDHDAYHALKHVVGVDADFVWHKRSSLDGFDAVVIPGGFTYGDYLRSGAMAKLSPVMGAVRRFAEGGGPVIGICNGFQILLEAGLLPGAMLRNDHLEFRCSWVHTRVESTDSPFTSACEEGQVLKLPIAHQEGSYYAPEDLLRQLERRSQILLRYCDPQGRVTRESNPNGSLENIAGICNEGRNVFGLMPHPERCCEPVLGGTDGTFIFRSILGLGAEGRVAAGRAGSRSQQPLSGPGPVGPGSREGC